MAKRARGTTTRPGQRRPTQRPAARPGSPAARPTPTTPAGSEVVAPPSASLTPEEEARAAVLEAAIVAQERQAEATRRPARSTAEVTPRSSSPLAVAAANEYAYVARDVRKVAIVGGSLVGLLIALWVVFQVTGISF
jgi:hypothetical protein